jgi:hypothetical protein
VAAVIICGFLIVLILRGWIMIIRRPARLEVTTDAVRFVRRNGHAGGDDRGHGRRHHPPGPLLSH